MKTVTEYSKIKKALLKVISKTLKEQKLQILSKLANHPAYFQVEGLKKFKDKLKVATRLKITPRNDAGEMPIQRVTQCFYPPYIFAMGGVIAHPKDLDHSIIPAIYNPYSFANAVTGEMSLSVIAGQNYEDVYGGKLKPEITDLPVYFMDQCGLISHLIDLNVAYEYETYVTLTINIQLPANLDDVVQLQPGQGDEANLLGLVGTEGYIHIYTNFDNDRRNMEFDQTSVLFLGKSRLIGEPDNVTPYQSQLSITHSFTLPAGKSKFHVHIHPMITAYTANNLPAGNRSRWFALVDFRADQSHRIISDYLLGTDHPAPGAIKITSICVSREAMFSKLPDMQ